MFAPGNTAAILDPLVITPLVSDVEIVTEFLDRAANALTPALPAILGVATAVALAFAWRLVVIRLRVLASNMAVISRNQSMMYSALISLAQPRNALAAVAVPAPEPPPGHELARGLANELVRMRKRVAQLAGPEKTVDALARALTRLEQHLTEAGYSIRDLSGQRYIEGMQVALAHVGPNAANGIIRMVRPQLLLRGIVIDPGIAEIEQPSKQGGRS